MIVILDRLFFDKTNAPSNPAPDDKTGLVKFVYFILFLRINKNEKYLNRPKVVQWSAEFFPVVLLVFFVRGVMLEPFKIPSNSMMPTFLTGDFIVVSKMSYGINLPILNKKIIEFNQPERGDVVVFRYPNYERSTKLKGADFIKRVIGVPGDEIIYHEDQLRINGVKIAYEDFKNYQGVESGAGMTGFRHQRELLDGNPHDIILDPKQASRSINKVIVPAGHFLVMGDNRSRSSDSRFWGFVPESYILGKAVGIWMHYDDSFKFGRIGSID